MPRKGAIELSLGFIVAVVFAVVLLSLAIVWINSVFPMFGKITDDLFQRSQTEIQNTFAQTDSNFAIWPNRYDLVRNHELKMAAGIKNNAADGQTHKFVINIVPAAVSEKICSSDDLNTCSAPGGKTLGEYMQSWVTFTKTNRNIQINSFDDSIAITISPPGDVIAGTYIFNVVACKVEGSITKWSDCTPETLNWGGSPKDLSISIS